MKNDTDSNKDIEEGADTPVLNYALLKDIQYLEEKYPNIAHIQNVYKETIANICNTDTPSNKHQPPITLCNVILEEVFKATCYYLALHTMNFRRDLKCNNIKDSVKQLIERYGIVSNLDVMLSTTLKTMEEHDTNTRLIFNDIVTNWWSELPRCIKNVLSASLSLDISHTDEGIPILCEDTISKLTHYIRNDINYPEY